MKLISQSIAVVAGLLIASAVFTGCASTSKKLNEVALGQTKDEVIALLGHPHATTAQGSTEYLTYNLINKGAGDLREYTVKLVNGTVDSFGERSDFGPARLAGTNSPARN
jgi:hypothetical protein